MQNQQMTLYSMFSQTLANLLKPLQTHFQQQNKSFENINNNLRNMNQNLIEIKEYQQKIHEKLSQKQSNDKSFLSHNKKIETNFEEHLDSSHKKSQKKLSTFAEMDYINQKQLKKLQQIKEISIQMNSHKNNSIFQVLFNRQTTNQNKQKHKLNDNHNQKSNSETILSPGASAFLPKLESFVYQYKDRYIEIPLDIIQKNENSKNQIKQQKWISYVFQILSNETFDKYYKKQMTEQEAKVFFSENLILNVINLLKYIKNNKQSIAVTKLLDDFNKISRQALEYQLKKYPQKKKIFIKAEIQQMVQKCQTDQDPQYDILKNLNFQFEYNENRLYYRQIKIMINKIIVQVNKNYCQFQSDIKKVFIIKQIQNQDSFPYYNEKSKNNKYEYIQHIIGRKINENTPLFLQKQLESNSVEIKSPQILRILIKWIQQLEEKINKPDIHILNRYFPFVSKTDKEYRFSKEMRMNISNQFQQFQKKMQHHFMSFLTVLKNIQMEILNFIKQNKQGFPYIPQKDAQIGLTTHLLSSSVSETATRYLNSIIHIILSFQQQLRKNKVLQNKKNKKQLKSQLKFMNKQYEQHKISINDFCQINYITFNVYDLLRAKCAGTYEKVKIIYQNLLANKNFKIIRVKNRLQTGNRDFLINLKYKNTPIICQLQLGLVNSVSQKQNCLDHFNHFLYELKRSKYGALTQAAIINSYTSQTTLFFEEKIKNLKLQKQANMKLPNQLKTTLEGNDIVLENYKVEQQQTIFICHNCLQLKLAEQSFLNIYKHIEQNKYLCGQCVINSLSKQNKLKYLIGEKLSIFFEETNLKNVVADKQESYYLVISKNSKQNLIMIKIEDHFMQWVPATYNRYTFCSIEELNIKYIFKLVSKVKTILQRKQSLFDEFKEDNQIKKMTSSNKMKTNIHNQFQQYLKHLISVYGTSAQYELIQNQNYKVKLNQHKKKKQLQKLIESKVQLMDLQLWNVTTQFFQRQLLKIQQVKKLNLSENNLKNFESLDKFNSLEQLKLNRNKIESISLNLINLKKLEISKNCLISIDITQLVSLLYLDLQFNKLKTINLENQKQLKELKLSKNQFEQLKLTNPKLQKIDLSWNHLVNVQITQLIDLQQLLLYRNKLKSIEINNPNLINLAISFNLLSMFETPQMTKLKFLDLCNNYLSINDLNITKEILPQLQEIRLGNDKQQYTEYIINTILSKEDQLKVRQERIYNNVDDYNALLNLNFYPHVDENTFSQLISQLKLEYEKIIIKDMSKRKLKVISRGGSTGSV